MRQILGGVVGLSLVSLFFVGCGKDVQAIHKVLQWDSNTEVDMKEYLIYQCSVSPCLASGTPFTVVPHVAAQATHSVVIPDLDKFYVAYAKDMALNVSAPSATLFADLTPPAAPKNLRVQ